MSAAGVQVMLQNPAGEVLLQLRDDDPAIPFPGTWCIPGGHLEPGESSVACAVREVYEEMGLTIAAPDLRLVAAQQRSYGYEHTFWTTVDVDPAAIELTEGQAVRFFSRAQVAAMALGYEDGDVLATFWASDR